ncbi:MAG: hypothetical protein ACON4T_00245 [Synechococcus sp.]
MLIGSGIFCWHAYAPKRVIRTFTIDETRLTVTEWFSDQATVKVQFSADHDNDAHSQPSLASGYPVSLKIMDAWKKTLLATDNFSTFRLPWKADLKENHQIFYGKRVIYFRLKKATRLRVMLEVPEHLDGQAIVLEGLKVTITELSKMLWLQTMETLA